MPPRKNRGPVRRSDTAHAVKSMSVPVRQGRDGATSLGALEPPQLAPVIHDMPRGPHWPGRRET
jgi:hypothetical protein